MYYLGLCLLVDWAKHYSIRIAKRIGWLAGNWRRSLYDQGYCATYDDGNLETSHDASAKTLSDALAKLKIHLIEQGIIKA